MLSFNNVLRERMLALTNRMNRCDYRPALCLGEAFKPHHLAMRIAGLIPLTAPPAHRKCKKKMCLILRRGILWESL